jgi:hypothetical protein
MATSIAVFFNWFFSFIVSFSFPYINVNASCFVKFYIKFYSMRNFKDVIGIGYSFVIYGVLLIFFALFTFYKVPETKNKSIQEISKHFEKPIRYQTVNNF